MAFGEVLTALAGQTRGHIFATREWFVPIAHKE